MFQNCEIHKSSTLLFDHFFFKFTLITDFFCNISERLEVLDLHLFGGEWIRKCKLGLG